MTNAVLNFFSKDIRLQIEETLNWQSQINRIQLTKREQEVLQIMSMGWKDEKAASSLYTKSALVTPLMG